MKFLILIMASITFIISQEGQVTNVVAQQRTDGSHIVDISYDLLPDDQFPSFTVFAYISIDGGETFESFEINNSLFPNVLGDNVLPGIGKLFYWEHVDGYESISSDNIIFKISAYGHVAITLPTSFEMINIPSGNFMGHYYNLDYSNLTTNTDIQHIDGQDSLMNIDYDYEIMKYPVTNAQFCTFLIELYNQGLIGAPSGGVAYDYSLDNNPYPVPNPPTGYDNEKIIVVTESSNDNKIYFNGETYLVEEGYGNHPVARVYTYGMELFSEYYGLRLPTWHEYLKAFRGINTYDFIDGTEAENLTWSGNCQQLNDCMYGWFNYRQSGDTWETSDIQNTTPVNYYDGSLHGDFQTNNAVSEYGLYDMMGNLSELTSIDAACHDSYNECGDPLDPASQPVNSIGIPTTYKYLFTRLNRSQNGGYASFVDGKYAITSPSATHVGTNSWDWGFRCARTVNSQ